LEVQTVYSQVLVVDAAKRVFTDITTLSLCMGKCIRIRTWISFLHTAYLRMHNGGGYEAAMGEIRPYASKLSDMSFSEDWNSGSMHDGTIGRRYGAVFGVIGTVGKLFFPRFLLNFVVFLSTCHS